MSKLVHDFKYLVMAEGKGDIKIYKHTVICYSLNTAIYLIE